MIKKVTRNLVTFFLTKSYQSHQFYDIHQKIEENLEAQTIFHINIALDSGQERPSKSDWGKHIFRHLNNHKIMGIFSKIATMYFT